MEKIGRGILKIKVIQAAGSVWLFWILEFTLIGILTGELSPFMIIFSTDPFPMMITGMGHMSAAFWREAERRPRADTGALLRDAA